MKLHMTTNEAFLNALNNEGVKEKYSSFFYTDLA